MPCDPLLNDKIEADNDHSGIGLDLEAGPNTGEIKSDKTGLSVDRAFPGPQHPQYVNTFFSEVVDYVYLGGELLVRIERTNDLGDRRFIYQHNDQVGTVAVTTDYNGSGGMGGMGSSVAILSDEFASPFGEVDAIQTSQKDRVNFAGHVRDEHSQLTYMQARLYSPVIGRFLSIDPITFMDTGDTAQFNRYAYANNDPINMFDPDGEDSFLVSRPLGSKLAKGHNHMFVAVRNNETGAIRRFSYGPQGDPIFNPGKVVSHTGTGTDTDNDDQAAMESFFAGIDSGEGSGDIVGVQIDAPDPDVIANGEAVDDVLGSVDSPSKSAPKYDMLPIGKKQSNSNGAAMAVSRMSNPNTPEPANTSNPGTKTHCNVSCRTVGQS